jgi:F-type H+-transporting ATPase subunit delta
MQSAKQLRREAKQLFRLCLVAGLLDEDRVRQAVERVVEAKRRGAFTLLSLFQRLVRLERSRHAAEVASATALPAELQASVLANLERLYGPGLNTSFVLNPGLIGGMRIQAGSDVYDGSVRSGLAAVGRGFLNGI